MFPVHQESGKPLTETSSFRDYLEYYCGRKGIKSENKLAECVRINQSRMTKITNNKIIDVDVKTLVAICLVLELNLDEAKDLMARRERAFSPANPNHKYYEELIVLYSHRNTDYSKDKTAKDTALNEADEFLRRHHAEALQDVFR